MSYLVSINKNGRFVLCKEAYKLCEEFELLDEKEILCIALAYDYYSPYRQFPEDERIRRAKAHVYSTINSDFFDKSRIKKAVDAYKSLQFDPRREQIKAYQRKLISLNNILDLTKDSDLKSIKEVTSSSKEIRRAIAELEDEIYKEEEQDFFTDDDKKLSVLERLIKNKERYLEITKIK